MSDLSAALCRTCNHTMQWHRDNNPFHPFNDGSAGATAFLGRRGDRAPTTGRNGAQRASETPSRPVFPSDPVLRVALVNAGILTTDMLRTAEESLAVAFSEVGGRGGVSESPVHEGSPENSDDHDGDGRNNGAQVGGPG